MADDYDYADFQRKKAEKREKDKSFWPKGSLERTLAKEGVKSLAEAVKKASNSKSTPLTTENPSLTEIPVKKIDPLDEAMSLAIKEIELLSKDFDFSILSEETTSSLANMPLNTIEEVARWLKAWKEILVTPYAW